MNQEVQVEVVNDPNQLTLGLEKGVPTKEIQDRIDRFMNEQVQRLHNSEMQNRREVRVLTQAGFKEGIDFVNSFEVEDVVEERDFSKRWYDDNNEPCMVQVAYKAPKGGVNLKTNKYVVTDGKVEISERNIWFNLRHDDKIECSTLVGTYRAVKPETLLVKLHEYAERELYNANRKVEQFDHNSKVIAELTKQYPQAIEVKKDKVYSNYSSRSHSLVERIVVLFEDGSTFQYSVNYTGQHKLESVFDAVQASKTLEEQAAIVSSRNV